jgi:MnmE helical domain
MRALRRSTSIKSGPFLLFWGRLGRPQPTVALRWPPSQAESVAQLLGARTAAAADSALAGLSGGIGAAVSAIRSDALAVLAELEARIDFDEDMPALDAGRLQVQAGAGEARGAAVGAVQEG